MLKIIIPRNNLNERMYVIDYVFNEILRLTYELEFSDSLSYYRIIYRSKEIHIKDEFFGEFPDDLSYLSVSNLPVNITWAYHHHCERDLPVLFGKYEISQKADVISYGVDLIASIFFMLTRWEEYALVSRDRLNRFEGKNSIAVKEGFIHIPVVNCWIECIQSLLRGISLETNVDRVFRSIPTVDVDDLRLGDLAFQRMIRLGLADLIMRRDVSLFIRSFLEYLWVKLKIIKDPFFILEDMINDFVR